MQFMIIRFSVSSYRLFFEKATLSMEATKDKILSENKFSCKGYKNDLLKTAVIYGANASGKSTMFQALNLFTEFIRSSASYTQNMPLDYTPFAFCDFTLLTSMECEFITKGIRYQYRFLYNNEEVIGEHLYSYPNGRKTIVFERVGDIYTFKSDIRLRKENARRVGPKSLYVSVCSQFNDKDCLNVFEWASEEISVLVDQDVSACLNALVDMANTDERMWGYVLKAIRLAGLGILDVYYKGKNTQSADAGAVSHPIMDIWVMHHRDGVPKGLPISAESSGTVRFLAMIGPIVQALANGTTLAIDEMDLSLHPDLCRWIFSLFLDPSENQKNAQLIVNVQDVSLLDQSLVRRDQIWLSIRDLDTGKGQLRRLSDYSVRNDLDIRKAYLNGSFGGRPFIVPDKVFEDQD